MPRLRARVLTLLVFCLLPALAAAGESWQAALSRMPLGREVAQLDRNNCVDLMLRAFQSNGVVKALVFMPGATDEFYLFRRAKASLEVPTPSLVDAVAALTNQTQIRATFRPPFLLLHTDEDPLEPEFVVEDPPTAERLKLARFVDHVLYNDRDWDYLQPVLRQRLRVFPRPVRYSRDSWHFYRHSFAAWNLSGWEALETIALAGKTKVTIRKREVLFEVDRRTRLRPDLNSYLR